MTKTENTEVLNTKLEKVLYVKNGLHKHLINIQWILKTIQNQVWRLISAEIQVISGQFGASH